MNRHNFFVKLLNNIYRFINSLLEKYLNKLNINNLGNISHSNKVFLIFVTVFILFLSYLSIPHTFNKAEIHNKLHNQLLNKLSLDFTFSKKFNYKLFPKPHFVIENSSILENGIEISNIKKLQIFVSLKNLFSLQNMIIKDVILQNSNFNLNNKNSHFFNELLENNFSENKLVIKNSNVFFRSAQQEVLFINKIINMKFFYDPKDLRNTVFSENEIFNIPYSFEIYKDEIKKKLYSKINLNFINLQIKNEFNYAKDKKKGLANIFFNKNYNKLFYEWTKDYFNFKFLDRLNNSKFIYEGNIYFNPFYSIFTGKIDKINISNIFNSNSLFSDVLKTKILNNKNLNVDLNINAKEVFQFQNIIDVILKLRIQEGLIDIDNTKFSWSNNADFIISNSLIYFDDNQLVLDGKILLNIKNDDQIYRLLQTSRNLRPELKKIEFDFNYNFDQQIINLNTILVDDKFNNKVNKVLKRLILKKDKLQNKIYFRNILREAIVAYSG